MVKALILSRMWGRNFWLSAACFLGPLSGCVKVNSALPVHKAQVQGLPEDYLTAQEGLALARQTVLARAADALLVGLEGIWIERGGRSLSWSYRFVSASRLEELTWSQGELKLISPLAPNAGLPTEIRRWVLDSDAALIGLEARDEPAYPLGSMRLEDGVWQIRSASVSWRLDAVTGQLLP